MALAPLCNRADLDGAGEEIKTLCYLLPVFKVVTHFFYQLQL